jgi:hypothetical protein
MANKSKFLVVPYELLNAGGSIKIPNARLTAPENVVEVKPPIGMVVTRVTIQSIQDSVSDVGAVLMSDHIPNTSSDGFVISGGADASGIPLPGQFTLENFGDESFSQSIYLANITAGAGAELYITVLFEGFINE